MSLTDHGPTSNYFNVTPWERLQESTAVGSGHNAIVENDDNAAVTFRSNQAPYALAKFKDRLRQRIFREGIAAALLDQFEFCFDEGMIGHGKRQARNDDIRKRLARDIDAAPKAVRAEQDTARG